MFMLNGGKPEDVLELRRVIEVEAAALAAGKITEEEKDELKSLMRHLEEAENEQESSKADMALHYAIAKMSGNYLILILLNTISSLMESFIRDARGMILREESKRDLLIEEHQKICQAIIQENPEASAQAMREHLHTINESMIKLQKQQAGQ
jgi:GntR family transcriptional repressor for pyruvate dehydrogenase complex